MLQLPTSGKVLSVFFSLGTMPSKIRDLNCVAALVDLFEGCKTSAKVAIYSLTEPSIIDAIIRAHKRGVEVLIIADANQAKSTTMKKAIEKLRGEGIKVVVASKQKYCMHHKVAMFDRKIIATGSFNWSTSASKRNDENLVIIEGAELAELFEKYVFKRILETEL